MSFSDPECPVCEQAMVSENGYCAGCGTEVCPTCGKNAEEFDDEYCIDCGTEIHPND